MATATSRFVPASWLRLPARSARLRLTLMYSGLFLLLGSAVVAIIFVFVWTGTAVTVASASPAHRFGIPDVHVVAAQQHSADQARLVAVAWLTLVITAIASVPLGWFAAGWVLRPLRKMTDAARTISAGNLHQRLALAGPEDEFKQLGDTIDDLLARLEASFGGQRRFVANAAHELRTPLTVERTLLQVALADPDVSAASLRGTCEELLAAGRDQERLLDALLTLATSERGLERREPVYLERLAREQLDAVSAELEGRAIKLTAELGAAPVFGDPALLDRLIANLIDNAIRYNEDEGSLVVRTGAESSRVELSVSNTGAPIPVEDLERLFEPFQRLGRERTTSDGHHGLGLSIVHAIAQAHDATVAAVPRQGGGLVVTVSFPAGR